jgi:hypothetical protein
MNAIFRYTVIVFVALIAAAIIFATFFSLEYFHSLMLSLPRFWKKLIILVVLLTFLLFSFVFVYLYFKSDEDEKEKTKKEVLDWIFSGLKKVLLVVAIFCIFFFLRKYELI